MVLQTLTIMHNKGVNVSIINKTVKYTHANIGSM